VHWKRGAAGLDGKAVADAQRLFTLPVPLPLRRPRTRRMHYLKRRNLRNIQNVMDAQLSALRTYLCEVIDRKVSERMR
jgi:hypothetical protein